jgi:hypothetical protein
MIAELLEDYALEHDGPQWSKIAKKWVCKGVQKQIPEHFEGIPIFKPYPVYGYLEEKHFRTEGGLPVRGALFIVDDRSPIAHSNHEGHRYPTMGYNFGGRTRFEVSGVASSPLTLFREGGTYEREKPKWEGGWRPQLKVWKYQREADDARPYAVCLVVPWQGDEADPASGGRGGRKRAYTELEAAEAEWIDRLASDTAATILRRLPATGNRDSPAAADGDDRLSSAARRRLRTAIVSVWAEVAAAGGGAAGKAAGASEWIGKGMGGEESGDDSEGARGGAGAGGGGGGPEARDGAGAGGTGGNDSLAGAGGGGGEKQPGGDSAPPGQSGSRRGRCDAYDSEGQAQPGDDDSDGCIRGVLTDVDGPMNQAARKGPPAPRRAAWPRRPAASRYQAARPAALVRSPCAALDRDDALAGARDFIDGIWA